MNGSASIRVFLLDDHEVVREGLRRLLEAEGSIEVVGEASTAAEALEEIPELRPDVAVLDVRLPDGSGIEVCREIRSSNPEVACLMLTSYTDDEALLDAIMAGAAGYVLKEVRGFELANEVRQVAAGHTLIDAGLAARVMARLRSQTAEVHEARLTPQEQRILDLIAEGLTNRQIGVEMDLAEKTV
ncbi:MAG TPA: DNA-binding response regulator, partial [Acidimicrobiaceae bacterium]|nr:DNA-binding response regulator [Acidimicrobiaceae bacterium]